MASDNFIGRLLGKSKQSKESKQHLMILNDQMSVYTDRFGREVYYSDIVKAIFHVICEESSKLKIKCVHETINPHKIEVVENSITKLFKYQPNPLMITRDFLYKVRYNLLKNFNSFIYPRYKALGSKKEFTDFLIIEPTRIEFYVDESNDDELYIEISLKDGSTWLLNYEKDIIHLRHSFGEDDYLGGGYGGTFENQDLLKTIDILNDATDLLPSAIKNSLKLRGLLKPRAIADGKTITDARDEFERHLLESKTGIAVTDLSADFTPISINPQLIDANTLTWLESRICKSYGVSLAMLSGDYTDQQKIAFHQRCIEGFKDIIEQGFTSKLLTKEEQGQGLQIKVYDNFINNLSYEMRIRILESASALPIFSIDEMREMFGQAPVGDNRRFNSLNNMDADRVTEYQMGKVKTGGTDKNESK